MPKGTPTQASSRWLNGISSSGQRVTQGVDAVTEAPGVKAAAAQDKMLRNLTEAVTSGRWAQKVSAVPLSSWKTAMKDKGIPAMSRGAQLAQPKVTDYYQKAWPVYEQLENEISSMPDASLEDSIQRSAAWIRGAHERLTGL